MGETTSSATIRPTASSRRTALGAQSRRVLRDQRPRLLARQHVIDPPAGGYLPAPQAPGSTFEGMSEQTTLEVDDELGEFTLPHIDEHPVDPGEQRDHLDDQIMAALVSP